MGTNSFPVFLEDIASRFGKSPAIVASDRTISFKELVANSRRMATGLKGLGLEAGDRLAFWLPGLPEYLDIFFGGARLGLINVAVNPRFRASEVADILSRSGAKALVLAPDFREIPFLETLEQVDRASLGGIKTLITLGAGDATIAKLDRLLPGRQIVAAEQLGRNEGLGRDGDWNECRDEDAGVAIFTTSGTTKAPKFVLHTHGSLIRHARNVGPAFGYDRPGTRLLQTLPYTGVFGFAQAMAALAAGVPTVLQTLFDAPSAAALINRHGITHMNGSDDMMDRLLQAMPGPRPFPTLRTAGYAAFNPALTDLVARGDAAGITFFGLYGMSEVQALFARVPDNASPARRQLAGGWTTCAEAQCRIRNTETGALQPVGESGELEVRGPSLMKEYFLNPDATREAFTEDGWLRTGDLAKIDENGGMVFLTRMGDVLRLGGYLVAPAEIEDCLMDIAGISGAQVVAASTPKGNRPVAFVTLDLGAAFDEAAAREFCAAKLARFKVPVRIEVLEAFPVTQSANGVKIRRTELRQMAEKMLQAL